MNFAVLADQKVEINLNENMNKYLDLAREKKRICETRNGGDNNFRWFASKRNWRNWKSEE